MNPGATLPAMGRFKANQAWKLSFCEAGRVLLWRFQCSITCGAGTNQKWRGCLANGVGTRLILYKSISQVMSGEAVA